MTVSAEQFQAICNGVWRDRAVLLKGRGFLSGEAALMRAPAINERGDARARHQYQDARGVGRGLGLHVRLELGLAVGDLLVRLVADPGDLVLDPTCGSGTTAYVAEQWGRRWITIDTSRVALALARQRLMGAKYPWYLLADSREGHAKEQSLTATVLPREDFGGDIRHGFVYERIQHITLKSIANNPDIISTIADVTFYGRDMSGHDVNATASIPIVFANWADSR